MHVLKEFFSYLVELSMVYFRNTENILIDKITENRLKDEALLLANRLRAIKGIPDLYKKLLHS